MNTMQHSKHITVRTIKMLHPQLINTAMYNTYNTIPRVQDNQEISNGAIIPDETHREIPWQIRAANTSVPPQEQGTTAIERSTSQVFMKAESTAGSSLANVKLELEGNRGMGRATSVAV